jgi:circadian clock protein KaiB
MKELKLTLYITGKTALSNKAAKDFITLCDLLQLNINGDIAIVDIENSPTLAEQEKIIVTPTLIRDFPLPKVKIVGDISNTQSILNSLNYSPESFIY